MTQEMTRAERRRAVEQESRSQRSRRRRGAEAPRPVAVAASVPVPSGAVALLERVAVQPEPPEPVETRSSRTGRREAHRARRGHRRRTAGAIAVVAVLGLGGTAAVAWAGLLPGEVERLVAQVAGPQEVSPPVAEPAPVVAASPSVSLTESADERLLSTVDLCRSLSRGELDPASASYRTLVTAAGAADLDAWCADLTGDAARADS